MQLSKELKRLKLRKRELLLVIFPYNNYNVNKETIHPTMEIKISANYKNHKIMLTIISPSNLCIMQRIHDVIMP